MSQGKTEIPGVDDDEEASLTDVAFDILGFSKEEKENCYKITASVMHFGSLKFKQRPREEQAEAGKYETVLNEFYNSLTVLLFKR